MKTIQFTDALGYSHKCVLEVSKYSAGKGTAIQFLEYDEEFECWFPYATATVNLGNKISEEYAYLDTNNFPQVTDIFEKYGFGKYTGNFRASGFCIYPLYKLNLKKVMEYTER